MNDTDKHQKIKVIALFGKSGSGKDTTLNRLIKYYGHYCHKIISCTTRPIRENEKDGEDYYFVSPAQFTKLLLNNYFLEATSFNEWFYGTPFFSLKDNKINVGVFNIEGIYALLEDSRLEVIPIYITAKDKTRLLRCLEREENPDCSEISRRFLQDEKDFSEEWDFDWKEYSTENDSINETYWYPTLFQQIICKWTTLDKIN